MREASPVGPVPRSPAGPRSPTRPAPSLSIDVGSANTTYAFAPRSADRPAPRSPMGPSPRLGVASPSPRSPQDCLHRCATLLPYRSGSHVLLTSRVMSPSRRAQGSGGAAVDARAQPARIDCDDAQVRAARRRLVLGRDASDGALRDAARASRCWHAACVSAARRWFLKRSLAFAREGQV